MINGKFCRCWSPGHNLQANTICSLTEVQTAENRGGDYTWWTNNIIIPPTANIHHSKTPSISALALGKKRNA
jgi:hypothetical protein